MVKNSKKKLKGGAGQNLNIPKYIPQILGKEILTEKTALLKYDKNRESNAEKVLAVRTSEYENEKNRLEKLKEHDEKLAEKISEEAKKRNERIWQRLKNTTSWLALGLYGIFKSIASWFNSTFIWVSNKLSNVGGKFYNSTVKLFAGTYDFINRWAAKIYDSLGPVFKYIFDKLCKLLDWLIRMLGPILKTFRQGPWARWLVLIITVLIILYIIFGWALPSTTHQPPTNSNPSKPGDNSRVPGSSDDNSGGGGVTCASGDTSAEEMPTFSSIRDSEYINNFSNFFPGSVLQIPVYGLYVRRQSFLSYRVSIHPGIQSWIGPKLFSITSLKSLA